MNDEAKLRILIEAHNRASKAFDEVNSHVDKVESRFKSFSDKMDQAGQKMKDVGGRMTTTLTLPIVAGAGLAVKAFSDLNETLNKVDVSFGNSAVSVREWSKTSIQSMGLAQQSALDAAALFGDMGTGMGQTQAEAAKMSMSLVQLGADMASFKNVSNERAQTALAGIYTGETEALKGLGIVMTEANLEAFAMSQGITTNIKDMTQAEKVQLRYAYVMSVTKNAQGDFARTSSGLANQTRMTGERFKQLSAEIGEKLAPVMNKILEVVNKVITKFGNLSDTQQNVILVVLGVVAALGPMLMLLGSIATGIGAVTTALTFLAAHPIVLVIIAIVAALGALAFIVWKNKEAFEKLWNETIAPIIMPALNSLKDTVMNQLVPALQRLWDTISPVLIPALKVLGIIVGVLIIAQIWIFINVLKIIIAVIAWVIDKIATLIQWLINAGKWFWNMASTVGSAMATAYRWVVDKIGAIISWFRGLPGSIGNAIGGIVGTITSPFKSAFNAVAGFWNRTVGNLSFKAPDWVPGLGGKGFSMPKIPTLFTGVKNFRGGPAVVGDVMGRGGEILNLPKGTDVFSNTESKNILRSLANGGNQTPTVVDSGIVFNNYGNINNETPEASEAFWEKFNRISELAIQGVPTNG